MFMTGVAYELRGHTCGHDWDEGDTYTNKPVNNRSLHLILRTGLMGLKTT